jgi:hypothetical protein
MHGLARVLTVQTDHLRWKTLGKSEPQFVSVEKKKKKKDLTLIPNK